MKLVRWTTILPVLIVVVVLIGGCAFAVLRTGAPESELSSVQHQIHFIDGQHHAVRVYAMEDRMKLAREAAWIGIEAQQYLEDHADAAILGEACDGLQQSVYCEG